MEQSEKILNVADSVEEVADNTTDVVETPQESEEKVETPETTAENTTENVETPAETKSESKTQSSEENAKFAQIRRKAEEDAAKKFEAERQKAYNEGRLEAYRGKVNPYTDKPINDLMDIKMYETMSKLEKEGKDPIMDLPEELARVEREKQEAEQKKKEMEEQTKKEVNDFQEKYPDVNLGELLQDSLFKDYIDGKNKPITDLYEGYINMKNSFRNAAVGVAKQTIANAQATPGALGSGAEVTVDYSTMTSEEFAKHVQRVKDGELR